MAVFAALPAGPALDYIEAAVAPGGSILDLGCGAGRLAHPLAGAGHAVTAVDECAAMLACIRGPVRAVQSRIEELALGERFDGVVAASYLVNCVPGVLDIAAAHLAPRGAVVVQRYDPAWVAVGAPDETTVGNVTVAVSDIAPSPTGFRATVRYTIGGQSWIQAIDAAIVDDARLGALAASAGLVIDGWLDEYRTWARLTAAPAS